MNAILEGTERLKLFRKKINDRVILEINRMIAKLDEIVLSKSGAQLRVLLEETLQQSVKASSSITIRHKQYHTFASKLLKLIEKESLSRGNSSDDRLPCFPRAAHLQHLKAADPYMAFIIRHFAWFGNRDAALSITFSSSRDEERCDTSSSSSSSSSRTGGIRLADEILSRAEWHHMDTVAPVITGIRRGDFQAFEAWVVQYQKLLSPDITRELRFERLAVEYLSILERDGARAAVAFAQKHFVAFHTTFREAIGRLMALLLWRDEGTDRGGVGGETCDRKTDDAGSRMDVDRTPLPEGLPSPSGPHTTTTCVGGAALCPDSDGGGEVTTGTRSGGAEIPEIYACISASQRAENLCLYILQESATLHKLPPLESSLQTLAVVGLRVVEPALFRIERDAVDLGVYQTENGIATGASDAPCTAGGDTENMQEIPVELSLPKPFTFHSTFSCPVSWHRASVDDQPVLLRCGHVLLASTAASLPRLSGDRLECPTCYNRETRSWELITLFF